MAEDELNKRLLLRQALAGGPERTLRQRLVDSVDVMSPEVSRLFFGPNDNVRWGESKFQDNWRTFSRPRVYINDRRFREHDVSPAYREKAIFGEALHNLKFLEPQLYDRLEKAALSHPAYRENAETAYQMDKKDGRTEEDDTFSSWHRRSRFDQVIGGFLQGQDPDLPSMKNWSKDHRMFGEALRKELQQFERDLDLPGRRASQRESK